MPRNPLLNKKFLAEPSTETLKEIAIYRSSFYEKILNQFQPDKIVIWNGLMDYQSCFISIAKKINPLQEFSFLEAGWFPQKNTYYSDPKGVNAASTIAEATPLSLSKQQVSDIKKWKIQYRSRNGSHKICDKGYYFVPLQLESDTNITLFSPFKNMSSFLQWVVENTDCQTPIITRPHPLSRIDHDDLNNLNDRIYVDKNTPLHKLIAESRAVIGINSTVLLESLIYEKPTIALGQGLFQSSKAIHLQSLDAAISNELSRTRSSIATQETFLYLLRSHQKVLPSFKKSQNIKVVCREIMSTKYGYWEQVISRLKIKMRKFLNFLFLLKLPHKN